MKKFLLPLLLSLTLITACSNQEATKNEAASNAPANSAAANEKIDEQKLQEYLDGINKHGVVSASFNKDQMAINHTVFNINDKHPTFTSEFLDAVLDESTWMQENISPNFTLNYFFEDDFETPFLVVKDHEVVSKTIDFQEVTKYETKDASFVMKNFEFLDGKYGKKILAITMDYVNKTDQPQNPWLNFATAIKGEQETDATVDLLNGANGLFPDDYKPEAVKMGETQVKPNTPVEVVVGFQLNDPSANVYLRSMFGNDFEKLIEQ